MAERTKLIAEARNSFGKGSSRQLRRAGRVPAVAYGHGTDPVHMSVDAHELFLAIKGQANALLDVELDGEKMLVLVKDIQRHPISRDYLHADLLRVKRGEKVQVEVPVEVIGEPAPGTIHTVSTWLCHSCSGNGHPGLHHGGRHGPRRWRAHHCWGH